MDRRALFTTLRIALIVSAWAGTLGLAVHSATAQVITPSEEAKGGLQAKGAQSEHALSRDDVIQLQKLLTALGYGRI